MLTAFRFEAAMKKIQAFFNFAIKVLMGMLSISVILTTVILDNPSDFKFASNSLSYPNILYYAAAILLIAGLIFIVGLHRDDVSENSFYKSIAVIGILTAVYQLTVSMWMMTDYGYDFGIVRRMAIELAHGGKFETFKDLWYFLRNEQNVNIAILFSWITRVTGQWRCVIYLGALLTNFSVILSTLSLYKLLNNRRVALLFMLAGEMLFAITTRAFVAYTDNYAMFFVALLIYLYICDLPGKYKLPSIFITAAIGIWLKVTVAIAFIAICLHSLLTAELEALDREKIFKLAAAVLLCGFAAFGSIRYMQPVLYAHYGYKADSSRKHGMLHFFMMGQNNERLGCAYGPDRDFSQSFKSYSERNKANLRVGIERIKNRGVGGNALFYLKKLDIAYIDGLFNKVLPPRDKTGSYKENLLLHLYLDKKLRIFFTNVPQVVWDAFIILFALSVFSAALFPDMEKKYSFLWITLLGITAYVLIFEDRAKYLYMFGPAFIVLSGIGFALLYNSCTKTSFYKELSCGSCPKCAIKAMSRWILTALICAACICGFAIHERAVKKDLEHQIGTLKAALNPYTRMSNARIDVKNEGPKNGISAIEISDSSAKVLTANGTDKNGTGLMVTSKSGNLKLKLKCKGNGRLVISLRGRNIQDACKKRLPVWVYYNKLIVDGKTVFGEVKPAWHDKPYKFTKDVKDGQIVDVQVFWISDCATIGSGAEKLLQDAK